MAVITCEGCLALELFFTQVISSPLKILSEMDLVFSHKELTGLVFCKYLAA